MQINNISSYKPCFKGASNNLYKTRIKEKYSDSFQTQNQGNAENINKKENLHFNVLAKIKINLENRSLDKRVHNIVKNASLLRKEAVKKSRMTDELLDDVMLVNSLQDKGYINPKAKFVTRDGYKMKSFEMLDLDGKKVSFVLEKKLEKGSKKKEIYRNGDKIRLVEEDEYGKKNELQFLHNGQLLSYTKAIEERKDGSVSKGLQIEFNNEDSSVKTCKEHIVNTGVITAYDRSYEFDSRGNVEVKSLCVYNPKTGKESYYSKTFMPVV